jgi:DNA-binding transcriptional MerR regulator
MMRRDAVQRRAARTGLRSGEAAARAGVSSDTLRFYERRGLLPSPPRDASGYRWYSDDAIARVQMIRQALDAGFTIAELARVLRARDTGGAPCHDVFAIASARLTELENRVMALAALRDRLRQMIEDWRQQLANTPRGSRARLLEGLASDPSGIVARERQKRLPDRRRAR